MGSVHFFDPRPPRPERPAYGSGIAWAFAVMLVFWGGLFMLAVRACTSIGT